MTKVAESSLAKTTFSTNPNEFLLQDGLSQDTREEISWSTRRQYGLYPRIHSNWTFAPKQFSIQLGALVSWWQNLEGVSK
jgi:hypothetical protein